VPELEEPSLANVLGAWDVLYFSSWLLFSFLFKFILEIATLKLVQFYDSMALVASWIHPVSPSHR